VMLKVTDTDTGRTGRLVREPGYVMRGSYVNPSWRIAWDQEEGDEDEGQD
jgi:hypothetical protein